MKELLDLVVKKHFINLGEYKFSPIMEASSGIALEYCNLIKKDELFKNPLFLCFPEKREASLWVSISILTTFFYEDFINNEVEGIKLKKGDKVKIYDCIAEIEKIIDKKVYLKFKDQGGIPIKDSLRSQISIVSSHRVLSLKRKYAQNYIAAKSKRNSISKILEPNESVSINHNNLDSKVLLITGRGNTNIFIDLLNKIKIYDEPLSKIFPVKKNLIISHDLKSYKNIFNVDKEKQLNEFKELLNKLLEIVSINEAKSKIHNLIDLLHNKQNIPQEFDDEFTSFILEFGDEITQLKFLEKKYPGIQDDLPTNLRAVIINNVNEINEYPNTIKGFLEKGIPVIFISNRNIDSINEIDFYKRLFSDNPEYFRINWNRKKIKALIEYGLDIDYIDSELWTQCKRYAEQQIQINVSSQNALDTLTPKLLKYIKELDNFETLQKAFYNYFYPVLYALKNSIKSNGNVKELILEFKKIFDDVKKTGISLEIIQEIEKGIQVALDFRDNTKYYNYNSNVFSNVLSAQMKINIPLEKTKVNIPNSSSENIVFTGYPYNEYSGKYLLNSICLDFVPDIKIICWPNEASLTHGYIKRRLKGGYFFDNLNEIATIKKEFLLKNEIDFENEIDSFLNMNNSIKEENTQEVNLEYLHTFKYKGYGNKNDGEHSFIVKCDILNFDDGSFMFLPKGSKILAQSENIHGKLNVSKKSVDELNVGDKIFKYIKDRYTLREISKTNKNITGHFEKLEYWKNALEKLYLRCNKDLNKLEILLKGVKQNYKLEKGNPVKSNLKNWLFDDEFLKPENENLKIIFLELGEKDIDETIKELDIAYSSVLSYTIGLSSNIKKNIALKLDSNTHIEDSFIINISGSEIMVESRTIAALVKNEIEIEYHNTRKILC